MSQTGWGTHLQDLTAADVLSFREKKLCINNLEVKAVQLTLDAFLSRIIGDLFVEMSDKSTVSQEVKGFSFLRHAC